MHFTTQRFIIISALSLLLGACNSELQEKHVATKEKDTVEANVNGSVINKSRVDLIARQSADGQSDNPQVRKEILDQLILQTLIANEALKKGLDKSSETVEQIDLSRQSILADAYVQDFVKNVSVTDDTLKAEYERLKGAIGNEYKARHILVEKASEASDIIAQLKKDPGSFEKLAREKSKDTASSAKGGDLGWFDPRRMVPEFGAALQTLEKGKFTEEPIVTSFGYHVILLDDARPLKAPAFEETKDRLAQKVQQQALMKHLEELKSKARIEMAKAPEPKPDAKPEPKPDAAKSEPGKSPTAESK